ncbi:MAG: molybdate ABC transporter substrate-binding protein [Planctomycetes bacterium]|nr:molybdate ABC transporter substrate-binding protein [Planctomycetota bacterium]
MRPWLALLFLCAACADETREPAVLAGAASSLREVLTEVSAVWKPSSGVDVRWSFEASSSLVQRQKSGAAMELLVVADEELAVRACKSGKPKALWANRIVLAGRSASTELASLTELLARPDVIALASAAVPAGAAARRVLREAGVLDALKPRFVEAPNVRAALALLQAGGAAWAFVYETDLVASTDLRVAWRSDLAGPGRVLCFAVLATAQPRASTLALFDLLSSPLVRKTALAHGFLPPEAQ